MNILLNKVTAEKYGVKYVVIANDIVMAKVDELKIMTPDDTTLPKWSDIAATEVAHPLAKAGIGKMLKRISGNNEFDTAEANETLVVTTNDGMNGAIALFYNGVLKALAGKYYLVPSSIHEWLAVPKSLMSKEDLTQIIRAVNAAEVAPDERLSDRPYVPVFRGKWTIEEA